MTRAISYSKNPYPANYDLGGGDLFVKNAEFARDQRRSQSVAALYKVFGKRK